MDSILLRTISAVDDKRLVLANGPTARALGIGSNWSTLRIGLRFCVNDPLASSIANTPVFVLGVCSGVTNIYGTSSASHFVGLKVNTASWTYAAGPPQKYGSLDIRPVVTVVGVDTLGGTTILNTVNAVGTPASNRSAWLIEITKGSPNFSINGVFPTSAQVGTDISYSVLKSATEAKTLAAAATALGMTQGTSRAVAVNESTNGSLDSVGMFWDRAAQTIEVSDVIVSKIA